MNATNRGPAFVGGAPPMVTVVTPTFNRADYLGETITSILDQDHPSIQLIVVDDGSTDDTAGVLDSFGDRVTVIRQANSGQVRAVNAGFAAAQGDYLTIVNDDDPLRPGALTTMVDALESNLDVLVAYPDWELIDADGETAVLITPLDYSHADMIRFHLCLPGPGAVFRRRVLERVGGWDTRYRWVADFDFWLRIGLLGPMLRVPHRIATWRRHPSGATLATNRLALALEQLAVIRDFFQRDDLPPSVRALEQEATASALVVAATVAREPGSSTLWTRFDIVDNLSRLVHTRVVPVGDSRADVPSEIISWQSHTIARNETTISRLRHDLAIADNHIAMLRRTIEAMGE